MIIAWISKILALFETKVLKFEIYKKATNNNLIISNHSCHTKNVKQSALRSMFLRALRIVSPEFLNDEIEYIFAIGFKNGYDNEFISECFNLAKKTYYASNKPAKGKNPVLILPYHPIFKDISHPLNIINIRTVFSFSSTLGNILIRNSPKYDEGIVYQIPCDCKSFYVGQTSKPLQKRIKQHQYSIRTNDNSNSINLHRNSCNKAILWNESKELFKRNNYVERCLLESACISVSSRKNFNSRFGVF